MKFDLNSVVDSVKASLGKNKKKAGTFSIGTDLGNISEDPNDYVVMPDWFKKNYGIRGLMFGKVFQWAGLPDSGKTSCAITAMKAAQEQGYAVLYVETEMKTTEADLQAWGVDPNNIMLLQTNITEECFEGIQRYITHFFDAYPEEKLLLVLDSYGNTISQDDVDTDLTELKNRPGGTAKTNRKGMLQVIAQMMKYNIACLFINYTYSNMTSPGKKEAGGEALSFMCSLIVQTARKAWLKKIIKGKEVRKGAQVQWTVKKNHFAKNIKDDEGNIILLPPKAVFDITKDGIQPNEKE